MQTYIGTKIIRALPMTRQEYNDYRGWQLPADENGDDEGYLVEYVDGGKANDQRHAGYISWSPKDVFERSYRPMQGHGLPSHQQRVAEEKYELNEKLGKLLLRIPEIMRAKIERMEKQEPYSYIYEYSNPIDGSPVWRDVPGYWNAQYPKSSKPLYALPGVQPAPSVPAGWKLVPIEPTEEMMMRDSSCQKHAHDDQSCVHRTNRRWIWETMLAAAPEAIP